MKRSKKELGFALPIVIIIVALLIAAGGGYYAYKTIQTQKKEGKDIKEAKPELTPSPELTPTPQETEQPADETANWKTYTNSETGFSFKYPEDISLVEDEIVRLSLWGPTQKPETEFYDGISLQFELPFKLGNTPLENYVQSAIEAETVEGIAELIKDKEKIVINGLEGYTFTIRGLGDFQYIYLQSSDSVYAIEIVNATQDPTGQGFQQTVDLILSTSKFIK